MTAALDGESLQDLRVLIVGDDALARSGSRRCSTASVASSWPGVRPPSTI
jgi:hypothetical protein